MCANIFCLYDHWPLQVQMGRCVWKHKIQNYLNANQKHSNRNTKNPNTNPDSPDTHKKTQNAPNASRLNPDCSAVVELQLQTQNTENLSKDKKHKIPQNYKFESSWVVVERVVGRLLQLRRRRHCRPIADCTIPLNDCGAGQKNIPSQHRRHHCHHYRHHHHCHHLHCHHNCHHFLDLMTQNELLD